MADVPSSDPVAAHQAAAELAAAGLAATELSAAELTYLDARDLLDRREINRARGEDEPGLDTRANAAVTAALRAIAGLAGQLTTDDARPADARAAEIMKAWARDRATDAIRADAIRSDAIRADAIRADAISSDDFDPDTVNPDDFDPDEPWAITAERGFDALTRRIETDYAIAQGEVDVGDVTLTRLAVLERLSIEAHPSERRRLFYALEPTWQSIDGTGGSAAASPYQRLLSLSAARWASGASPVDRNAAALGLTPAAVEANLVAILETWRDTYLADGALVEPWDWWYAAGAAARALRPAAPLHRIQQINNAFHASLGADPATLGVGFDVFPRPGRPLVPVAYTDFGGRPRRGRGEPQRRAKAWVMGTYTAGGLGELTELVHETGHAIHVAAIDTRPAFADWPDSDAFTEALAELTGMDTAEPAWQAHWLGASVPEAVSLRCRYADVMLDVCWALFEIRLHADPDLLPNDVWAELTMTYLGIAPRPELSWWAMRGQLVQEPGYMVNYALGPIITADLRAAIRAARGDWSAGDFGWYGWVSQHIYRWGLERGCGDVLTEVLGRPLNADALLHDIRRGRPD